MALATYTSFADRCQTDTKRYIYKNSHREINQCTQKTASIYQFHPDEAMKPEKHTCVLTKTVKFSPQKTYNTTYLEKISFNSFSVVVGPK